MIVASLIHAGADPQVLRERLAALGIGGFRLLIEPIAKQGIAAVRFRVDLDEPQAQLHRHLKHILAVLDRSRLPEPVRRKAAAVFERLAAAEGRVHAIAAEKVHFHEVGAVDAIVDVVAAVAALDLLGVEKVYCSPIPVGSGTVDCEHGVLPVPAPATAELLKGVPLAECDEAGELTTPTAAAVLTTLAAGFGPLPAMSIGALGYGAGRREGRCRPNVLRVLIGDAAGAGDSSDTDEVTVLETNLDDASPQVIGYCFEQLLAEGALDVYTVPIHMKKSRIGVVLTVICEPYQAANMEKIVFCQTTTFGIRRHNVRRSKLKRRHETVATPWGEVRIKIGEQPGGGRTATPEYEDCKTLAERHGLPLAEVIAAAHAQWSARPPDTKHGAAD